MRLIVVPLLLIGCATTATQDRPGARGPRATEHLEAAREHGQAAERVRWPDRRPSAEGPFASGPESIGIPWFYYWDPAEDHERLAAIHRAAAAQIEVEYSEACGDAPIAQVSVSPIVRYAIGGAPVAHGAALYLSTEAGTPERVLAAMRCHRAWMMLGRSMMDDCPLDMAGIEVVAHAVPGAVEVLITIKDPALVPELQRRAAMDVEQAATRIRRTGVKTP